MEYSPISINKIANTDEVILNTSQQSNLASQLQPQDMGESDQPQDTGESDQPQDTGESDQSFISGKQILLSMNNYLRRSGRGEIK